MVLAMRIPTLLTALIMILPAGAALAHARLVRSEPAVGTRIDHAPQRIWLRFSDVIRPGASGVMLTAPNGGKTLLAPLARDPRDPMGVFAPLPARLGPGRYQVDWRALSPDGHRTHGQFAFTVQR
jgi:methionine-rich copper-binding protein CopC